MKTKLAISLLIASLFLPVSFAQSGSIRLLAVSEAGNNTFTGSVVDMNLEIKEGSGRVFIDSFPLTKLDTQITTRTANQIACDYIGDNCDRYDFFYTINSSASIVGGPSAGAATAALTVAVLQNLKINNSMAITGTINAGNIVGTVGGLEEKIKAAAEAGIKEVLIPYGEKIIEKNNKTKSLVDYGNELNVTVIEVSTLGEAMEFLTGKKEKELQRNFSISQDYISTMRLISERLCNRSTQIMIDFLNENVKNGKVMDNKSVEIEQDSINLSEKAKEALSKGLYYSAASYCYGAGLKNTQMMLIEKNLTQTQMKKLMQNLSKEIDSYEKSVDKWKINTITDLESYMVVKERLYEAKQNVIDFNEALNKSENDSLAPELASVISRLDSAKSWAEFYGKKGEPIKIDNESIRNSCKQKLAEAEERYQYVSLYFPEIMSGLKSQIEEAMKNYKSENYIMCLFLATKAKADINSIASSIGVAEEEAGLLINQRLRVAKDVIAEQNAKGAFPILGYSYYEYAVDLMQGNETSSKATALIYTGYALELSKLDIYFKEYGYEFRINAQRMKYALLFFIGFVAGVFVYDIIIKSRKKSKRPHEK
jgi:uncharacterized protein